MVDRGRRRGAPRYLGLGRETVAGPATPAELRSVLTLSLWIGRRNIGHQFIGLERVR